MHTREHAAAALSSLYFLSSFAKPGTSTSSQTRLFRIDSTLHCRPSRAMSSRSQSASCSFVSLMCPDKPISFAQFRCHIVALPTERSRSEGPASLSELRDTRQLPWAQGLVEKSDALPSASYIVNIVGRLLAPAALQLVVGVEVDERVGDTCGGRAQSESFVPVEVKEARLLTLRVLRLDDFAVDAIPNLQRDSSGAAQ